MDFTSLAGVMALFATKGGMVVGWVHYLAFDLFAGMWIARDADQKSFSRVVQFPCPVLTLMAGLVGLLAWLLVRSRRARALARDRTLVVKGKRASVRVDCGGRLFLKQKNKLRLS